METKRQQQQMIRVMGSTRMALGKFRDVLRAELRERMGIVCPHGGWVLTLSDALEELLRRAGQVEDSRYHQL